MAPGLIVVPCLYVIPTPIGNLEDITLRALRVLGEVDLILAEDTRRARTLLQRYQITTRVLSYHEHNKERRLPVVLDHLRSADVALISDAGTPGISDPGYELVHAAIDGGLPVDVLPGPNAAVTAVVAAALPAAGFAFLGFLPRTAGDRRRRLQSVERLQLALVLYEAPHRLIPTVRDALDLLGDRQAVIAREMTKLHQEYRRGRLSTLLAEAEGRTPRGEHTLVIAGFERTESTSDDEARAALRRHKRGGCDRRDAMRRVTEEYGVARNVLYAWWEESE